MAEKPKFIKEFLKKKNKVGAVAPSSKFLRKKMLKKIDFSKAKTIVELGPGTGAFTFELLDKLSPDGKLIVFETNESFFDTLRSKINDSRLVLLNRSAEDLPIVLQEMNINEVDYVVSSLPLAIIPETVKNNILKAVNETLSAEGYYIQFQYSLNAKKLLEKNFDDVTLDFTPINIPPAFVYRCKKGECA
jgi:phosphatidylethanolamine/phosphatidyl-N-methylethanolamine N-methyltransferase